MNMYPDPGHQISATDPNYPPARTQPATPQVHQPGGLAPIRYQQSGASYSQNAPNMSRAQYTSGTPYGGYQGQHQEQGYFPPQGQPGKVDAGLASQMGQMGLGGEGTGPGRPNKKKDRHAYHNLEQPGGSSPSLNGHPQGPANTTHFYNTDPTRQVVPGDPYAGQQTPSILNQFPAQAGVPFSPGLQAQNIGAPNPAITPSGPGVSASGRVDPEQIPSIPRSRDQPSQFYLDHIYPTMEQHLPPPGAVPFVAHDQGNSSPKYARLTINNIPSTAELLAASALPLGLVLQPLAPTREGEESIPLLDFGEQGPPRCRRCRAYINPFMIFRSGGNKLVCNMCTFPNDVDPEYFAPTDPNGVRVDRSQRPELTRGTVEFTVPKEYWAKEPVGLRWLFLIDVGQEAVVRGFLKAMCEGILNAFYGEVESSEDEQADAENPNIRRQIPMGSKVGIVTFDREMHFYNCHVCVTTPIDTPLC